MIAGHEIAISGIIPARAGFTIRPYKVLAADPDHPRSRGVYDLRRVVDHLTAGSSPLARGLRRRGPVGHLRLGIIPARAGFTCQKSGAG